MNEQTSVIRFVVERTDCVENEQPAAGCCGERHATVTAFVATQHRLCTDTATEGNENDDHSTFGDSERAMPSNTSRRDSNSATNTTDWSATADTTLAPRTRRAFEEEMDVSLLRKGGLYEVRSESGNVYEVDIADGSCTCLDWRRREPEGGCKHFRRVDMAIKAGIVPRPDGRLPERTITIKGERRHASIDVSRAIHAATRDAPIE